MLTDRRTSAQWHQLLNDNASAVKDAAKLQKWKGLENLYELLGFLKEANDPELTYRIRLDFFHGKKLISPIEDARLSIKGISEVIIEPEEDEAFAS